MRTKDPAVAKVGFARENAAFEAKLADARRMLAEGTLVPTPAALVQRWCEGPPSGNGLAGPQRLILALMELDALAGSRTSASLTKIYPPAISDPPANADWGPVLSDKARFETILANYYGGEIEQVGTNWIRLRWHNPDDEWRPFLKVAAGRLRGFDPAAERFTDDELADALLKVVDEKRTCDEEINRARLARQRPRTVQSRARPTLRLKQLFNEWVASTEPRPQTALEFEAAVDDFIDFAGDITVGSIDSDTLYDYDWAAIKNGVDGINWAALLNADRYNSDDNARDV